MDTETAITCPDCQGKKQSFVHLNFGGAKPNEWRWIKCGMCKGAGEISQAVAEHVEYGKHILADRKSRLKTLRQEAADLGCSCYELSQVEHGHANADLVARVAVLRMQGGVRPERTTP